MSRCQLEVDISYDQLIAHQPEGEWAKVAPFRILSFDIECAGRKGKHFVVLLKNVIGFISIKIYLFYYFFTDSP